MCPRLNASVRALIAAIVIVALACPPPAVAQGTPPHIRAAPLGFRTIDVGDGLPHNGAYGIARDRFGFLWIGTLDGLARYDGRRLTVFRPNPSDPNTPVSGQIWCLYADREGVVWAGTLTSGLIRYDPRTERFTNYQHDPDDPASLSHDAVRAIYEDSAGTLWVGTLSGGLNRLDRTSGRFTSFRHHPDDSASLSHNRVEDLAEDGQGGLWVATYGGLDRLDLATGRFTHVREDSPDLPGLGGDQIQALLRDHSGTLWVGAYGAGLYRLDSGTRRFTAYHFDPAAPYGLSSNNITALVEDEAGMIWVGTQGGGLNRLDRATGNIIRFPRTLPPGRGIPSANIMALDMTADGLLWVGTEERGVTMVDLKAKPFTIFYADVTGSGGANAMPPGAVRTVAADHNGSIWVGIGDGGLSQIDRRYGTVVTYRHTRPDDGSPLNNRAQAMLVTRDGTLWVGYAGGLDRFDRATSRFVHFYADPNRTDSLSHPDIFDLREGDDGAIWIATRGGGLNRLGPATGHFTQYRHNPDNPSSIGSDFVVALAWDTGGGLWIGTEDAGLSHLDPATGHFTHYRHDPADPASLGSNSVLALLVDHSGILWAATWNSGLDRFDPAIDRFTRYTEQNGLLTGKVNSIEEDVAGNLWLASNQGLTRFNPLSGQIEHFTHASAGLPSGGTLLRATAEGQDGELFVGGVDSLVTFFPEQIQTRTDAPPVVFSRFLLANQPVPVGDGSPLATSINTTDTLTLPYRDQAISFEFAALDYRASGAVRYRYRLDGFDKDWVETDSERRSTSYTNLDPGSYVFRLQATNGDGIWGTKERSIRLTITPPWWQTLWFRLLAGVGALAAIAGFFRYRMHQLTTRQQQLEAMVAARTHELDRQLALEHELITNLDHQAILDRILAQIAEIVPHETAAILTRTDEGLAIRAIRSTYLRQGAGLITLSALRLAPLAQALERREPQIIADITQHKAALEYLGEVFNQPLRGQVWLVVPLLVQGKVLGWLLMAHSNPHAYSLTDAQRLESFTSPIAIALQNNELRQAAQHAAVLEERNRLARELHDAVTQMLFSANLIAQTLLAHLHDAPEPVTRGARELSRLTAGALTEMRALLIELRPKTLAEKPLGHQIRLLCASLTSRGALPVHCEVIRDGTLAPAVQLTFYRIAQEALNNVVKHARATEVLISLDCRREEATLIVSDDGQGFEAGRVAADSFGLGIMEERAAEIGATLNITSEPGAGTTVTLYWRAPADTR